MEGGECGGWGGGAKTEFKRFMTVVWRGGVGGVSVGGLVVWRNLLEAWRIKTTVQLTP